MKTIIVWFRQDLRLADNPALAAAIDAAEKIVPLYIYERDKNNPWPMGEAQQWWLHHSLNSLNEALEKKNAKLILRSGNCLTVLEKILQETQADAVYWNRCYEPYAIARDTEIKKQLEKTGCQAKSFQTALLFEPWKVQNSLGGSFKVYTPFYKNCLINLPELNPLPAPRKINTINSIASEQLQDWQLLPTKLNWAKAFESYWQIGETAALKKLQAFLENHAADYGNMRDFPGENGVSQLSPHLHLGEISPKQVWYHTENFKQQTKIKANGFDKFLSQIIWREFSYHLLYHFPELDKKNFRSEFDNFQWQHHEKLLKCWQRGETGYPIVDAGMRQLWQIGWMHNRLRMITGSFLIKDLLIDWRHGQDFFWNTLVDADLANNAASWQWVAGSGADAAPYFRIFNPTLQSEKFDKEGKYIRHWLPELKNLPAPYIHKPWEAPEDILKKAGIKLGENYPAPIVDHTLARERALLLYQKIRV